jgi:hypothetical protein
MPSLNKLRRSIAYKRRRFQEPYRVTLERDRLEVRTLKEIVCEEIEVRRREFIGITYARQSVKGALGIDCPTPRIPTRRNVAFVARALESSPLVADAVVTMRHPELFKVIDSLVELADLDGSTFPGGVNGRGALGGSAPHGGNLGGSALRAPPLASDDNEPWYYATSAESWMQLRDEARALAAADSLAALATLLDRAHAVLENAAKEEREKESMREVISRMSSMSSMSFMSVSPHSSLSSSSPAAGCALLSLAKKALKRSVIGGGEGGRTMPKFSEETTEPLVKRAFELLEALRLDGAAYYQVGRVLGSFPETSHQSPVGYRKIQVVKPVFDAVTTTEADAALCAVLLQHAVQTRGVASTLMRCQKAELDDIEAGLHRRAEASAGGCNIWGITRSEIRRFRALLEPPLPQLPQPLMICWGYPYPIHNQAVFQNV